MLAVSASLWTPVLITLAGSGGIVGALVALVKLRGDTSSQAVSQAQGAMEVMEGLNAALEKERDYWRARYHECHDKRSELLAELQLLRREGGSRT
jgi:hypothetical protein